jgi:hypothetical protein
MTIDFVGDWCSPVRDKLTSTYSLPSWTEDHKCNDILSVDKYEFYFRDEKVLCEPENMKLTRKVAPAGTAYTARITARCQHDGPATPGELRTFEFYRYKGHLTVTVKNK